MNLCVNCQHHKQEWEFLIYVYDVPVTLTAHYCKAFAKEYNDPVTGDKKVLDAKLDCDTIRSSGGRVASHGPNCWMYKEVIPTLGWKDDTSAS